MKNNLLIQIILCITVSILAVDTISAQCNDLILTLTPTPSTCASNGSIHVAVSGADVGNIRQSDMQFQVETEGDNTPNFAPYPGDLITLLAPGDYTIRLRAFCYSENDFIVTNASASTTITSSYVYMDAILGVTRSTLSCIPTGMIPVTIMSGTGLAPFKITLKANSGSYTGTTEFSTNSTGTPYEIKNLPAGDYTVTVSDNCTYTKVLNATVGTMPQDVSNRMIATCLYSPSPLLPNQCDIVTIYKYLLDGGSYTTDEYHYYYSNASDYFEIAFLLNDIGTPVYLDTLHTTFINFKLPSPNTLKTFRANGDKIMPYVRIKGTNCVTKLNPISLYNPLIYVSYAKVGCTSLTVNLSLIGSGYNVICFPYKWRVIDTLSNVVIDWQGPISYVSSQVAENVPFGSKVEYEDSEGYTWNTTLQTTPPSLTQSSSNGPILSNGMTDSIYHSYIYFYVSGTSIPAGTRIEFVSGPSTPVHRDTTILTDVSTFFPFSPSYSSSSYQYLKAGSYVFNYTFPGCAPRSLTVNYQNYKLLDSLRYTTVETCAGLKVMPTGQLGIVSYWGSVTNSATYFYIYSTDPYNIPVDKKSILQNDFLFFPTKGEYRIVMTNYPGSNYASIDTIYYEPTPFQLNPSLTSAFVCEDENIGFIRVGGMGGSGNYRYELYDGTTLITTNTTGVFHYGTAGNNYTIRLIDTDPACFTSYDQQVNLIDLGIAQIAYTSDPLNKFCLADSVYLKCITLGQTTYLWKNVTNPGVGITPANEKKQNPAIAAKDLGVGTHTFSITVTPEGCGRAMTQSVTVTIEDCSGAHDDYATLLMNKTVTVDVLANDAFPLSCAASVVPDIPFGGGPTKGTYQLVSNKVVYTPNLNFIGRDSMTYSTTCGSTTTTAKVYFTVIKMPDNVIDTAGCIVNFQPIQFSIRRKWSSANNTAHANTGCLVGDLDGDGVAEIVTTNFAMTGLHILDGSTGATRFSISPFSSSASTGGWYAVSTCVLVDANRNGMGEIIHASSNGTNNSGLLTSYETDTTGGTFKMVQRWQVTFSSPTTGSTLPADLPQPIVADFNGDGVPEVVVFNQIFNAVTGALLGVTEPITTAYVGRIINRTGNNRSNFITVADFDGDELPEIVAGGKIYKVNINPAGTSATCSILHQVTPSTAFADGFTSVADIDLDGNLDVVVVDYDGSLTRINVWSPKTNQIFQQFTIPSSTTSQGYAFIGDIDGVIEANGKRHPEICVTTIRVSPAPNAGRVSAYRFNPTTKTFSLKWDLINSDTSGGTGITLFDFNNDGVNELVYRDEKLLYILDGSANGVSPTIKASFTCTSGTAFEYPVIADLEGSGSANICITCADNGAGATNALNTFESGTTPWAPTRKVWNQVNYEPTSINNNLTVSNKIFPKNFLVDTGSDSVWLYNGALIQVPIVDPAMKPIVLSPDPYIVSISSSYLSETVMRITVVIGNKGINNVNSSLPVSLYLGSIGTPHETRPIGVALKPGHTVTFNYDIPVSQVQHLVFVRLQDNGLTFPTPGSYNDCDYNNNVAIAIVNKLMQKNASLNAVPHNGTLSNPVATLYSENITYTITAVNANTNNNTSIVIRDTLPAYLSHVSSNPPVTPVMTGTPQRAALAWTVTGLNSLATTSVSVVATPILGVSASQPMFANRAWVTVSDTVHIPTNYTYHQGAGVTIATFSAGYGGRIYNAAEQVLDYGTSPYSGVVVIPDEGYRFAGWSHAAYRSLRDKTIQAQSGVKHYETLTIYGDVNLHADFELESYSITYHLHESTNAVDNPSTYTILSEPITLIAPEKEGDWFIGWTGSNGDVPQLTVVIPKGSTGERVYYANYLRSGRMTGNLNPEDTGADKIWASKGVLYVKTSTPGSIVRIYSPEGILLRLQPILHSGQTTIQLPAGLYVVTLNNGIGTKAVIND